MSWKILLEFWHKLPQPIRLQDSLEEYLLIDGLNLSVFLHDYRQSEDENI